MHKTDKSALLSVLLIWEQKPLMSLADDGELMAFRHEGFWQPMDTLRDKVKLQELWESNKAPWKLWK
jgi:glucose-1-phosphate cytidylyltransferase